MKGLKNELGEKKFLKLIHCVLAKESMQIMVLKHDKSKQGECFMNSIFRAVIICLMVSLFHCQGHPKDRPSLQGPYFGQKAPSGKAEVFMDGIISCLEDAKMCAAFTTDGKEFYYIPDGNRIYFGSNRPRQKGGKKLKSLDIFVTKRIRGNQWSKPEMLPFNSEILDGDMCMSANGNKLIFRSWRALPGEEKESNGTLKYKNR